MGLAVKLALVQQYLGIEINVVRLVGPVFLVLIPVPFVDFLLRQIRDLGKLVYGFLVPQRLVLVVLIKCLHLLFRLFKTRVLVLLIHLKIYIITQPSSESTFA